MDVTHLSHFVLLLMLFWHLQYVKEPLYFHGEALKFSTFSNDLYYSIILFFEIFLCSHQHYAHKIRPYQGSQ